MTRTFLFILGCCIGCALHGQNLSQVKEDVYALTDSALHGRGYVHDGSNKAAELVAQRFREIGIQPIAQSYFQPFQLAVNTYHIPSMLQVNGLTLREGRDYIADPWSGVSSGRYKLQHFDSTHFQAGSAPKLRKNRAPVVWMKGITTPEEVSAFHTFKLDAVERVPVVQRERQKLTWGVGQQRYPHAIVQVVDSLFSGKAKRMQIDIKPTMELYEAVNVVGVIPGLRSDSCMVITAHYDHLGRMGNALFPGANDNASGTATMLDLAAYFTAYQPPMDLYIIAFAGEEAGLAGSKHFVENPMFPLENIRFLINLDLLGSAAKGITIVNGTLHRPEMEHLGKINKAEGFVPKIKLRGKAANSDHYWFSEAGVPAIFIYTEGHITAYHDVFDLPGSLDWTNYEGVFNLVRTFIETF